MRVYISGTGKKHRESVKERAMGCLPFDFATRNIDFQMMFPLQSSVKTVALNKTIL